MCFQSLSLSFCLPPPPPPFSVQDACTRGTKLILKIAYDSLEQILVVFNFVVHVVNTFVKRERERERERDWVTILYFFFCKYHLFIFIIIIIFLCTPCSHPPWKKKKKKKREQRPNKTLVKILQQSYWFY